MTENERRLIEDYLPIEAISAEASREKSVRKGHISTLHLWWARRPLVACRAAVYGALVPASQFVPNGASGDKKKSLGRANAAKFVKSLCMYPGSVQVIKEAQQHILKAHAQRLTQELADLDAKGSCPRWIREFNFVGNCVTAEDITAGRAPRPRVLDMFAGGGSIPLEALRLGCEAYALDLNPVAYTTELCTLVYPQKYGRPDPAFPGMAGPKIADGKATWGGLAAEVAYWANWILLQVKREIGAFYPLVPDPEHKGRREPMQADWLKTHDNDELPPGYLMPVAYQWTRTVRCKNPTCAAIVPLLRQTWLCKKKDRYVALKVIAPKGEKLVRFRVVESKTERELGFDPDAFSKGGNATCPFCGTVADAEYVKAEGSNGRMGHQMMATICTKNGREGKFYFGSEASAPLDELLVKRSIEEVCAREKITVPNERISNDAKNANFCILYGLSSFDRLYTARQMLSLLAFAASVKRAGTEMEMLGIAQDRAIAVRTILAALVDKQADLNSSLCVLAPDGGRGIRHTFVRQALGMVWDFAEANPFHKQVASWESCLKEVLINVQELSSQTTPARVARGSATRLSWEDETFDAIVTDPPYYDNVPYANISDFFYVWLKRTVGDLFPEHFASESTPKKLEVVADATRHGGSKDAARQAYEAMMAEAFAEAHRTLKSDGELVVVYAHKTTLGWATLVGALRVAGFTVVEAWPLDTEMKSRLRIMDSAALASSIFLVARKREGLTTGNYENLVRPELEQIVRERVDTLWDMGISGADLVISCVGAGLRAFTRFARVEYLNGEEVPAERYLGEVETVVLENILARLSKEVGAKSGPTNLAGVDAVTRFYILWRFTYRLAELDSGEAIIFANGTHVELDGPHGLSAGGRALVEKKKSKYRLSDFSDRGNHKELGMPSDDGQIAPLIDALHRVLWLLENRPLELPDFLRDAQPDRDQMRLVAQALAGPALKGGELADVSPTGELAALAKLTANWRSVIEDATPSEREARRAGQRVLFEKGDNR